MFRKKDKTYHFTIPQTWNELNAWQRTRIAGIIYNSKNGDNGVYFAVIYYLFVSAPWYKLRGLKEVFRFYFLIRQVPISEYIVYCEFVFKGLDLTKFPKYITLNSKKYYGPADRLANLSMAELALSYKFYFSWMVQKSEVDLDRLITVLYRPEAPTHLKKLGDIREPFSEHTLRERSGILPNAKPDLKIAIGFAYKASTELIFSRYPELFPKPKISKKDKPPKFQSFVPMMRMMAMGENQPLGDYEKVQQTNANMFFDVAQETIRIDKKRQLEMEKLKRKR